MKIAFFIFPKSLDFAKIVWYCVVLTEVIKMNVITYLARSLFKKRTVDEVLRNQRFLRKDVGKTQVALRCDKKVALFTSQF